jgi:hypothetical protein
MYNMARRCKCAGQLQHTTSLATTAQLVNTFRGIAEHFHMPLLLEQVNWIFQMNPKIAAEMKMKISG